MEDKRKNSLEISKVKQQSCLTTQHKKKTPGNAEKRIRYKAETDRIMGAKHCSQRGIPVWRTLGGWVGVGIEGGQQKTILAD